MFVNQAVSCIFHETFEINLVVKNEKIQKLLAESFQLSLFPGVRTKLDLSRGSWREPPQGKFWHGPPQKKTHFLYWNNNSRTTTKPPGFVLVGGFNPCT